MQETPPPPPRRDATGSRETVSDPALCRYCRRHPRKQPGPRGGRPGEYCTTVWAVDERGREVTCARLDEADQIAYAAYGPAMPGLDVAAVGRDVSRALAEITPLQQTLAALDGRLDAEIAEARERVTEAEAARADAEARADAAEQRAVEAEAAAAEAADRAEAAGKRAAEAEERAAADRGQAQRAIADRLTAEGEIRQLRERLDQLETEHRQAAETAAARIEELTAAAAARASEAEAAHARARQLETDLRDLATQHHEDIEQLRARHDRTLSEERAKHREDRERWQAEHDERITALREQHEAALNAARERAAELATAAARAETAATEARTTATTAIRTADATAARLSTLREGVLTALADPEGDLLVRLRTLLAETAPTASG
ncbi:hypothetical protein [Amycolatopsis sp. ATCC 39116]|uniref:hypothetical protein n=1 Tax=Amycolatopsis sp. (strain ATCC 39116 / 75iv2) TaxID=385957 RepID=UPI001F1C71B0|nr:hypothetical protein [Amycolatopsis sp. ATCC 39116]